MIKPVYYRGQTAEKLFGNRAEQSANVEKAVKQIIENVGNYGDRALKEYARKFDGFTGDTFEVGKGEFDAAEKQVSAEYKQTLKRSIKNITAFHRKQLSGGFEISVGGATVGQKVTPVGCAGIYVPGGTAAYPSTVLMNAIPAKIAGVENLIMVTPVKADGKVRAEVLCAARLCGVDRVFKIGGAQAIAALAYGTQTIPKADKITGPGNVFVATAKKLVSGICGIDMVAGPSEILVLADGGANARHVAADLLSQAEHDVLASAVLITDSAVLADKVARELEEQVERLPRRDVAKKSIEDNCKIIITDSLEGAVCLSNEYAPEHLELCVKQPSALFERVKNAGSVFLGYNTPEAVGDYCAGANHTLPTGGTARFSSPLGVNDFVKSVQYVCYSKSALDAAADDIIDFANSEGLTAHAQSVAVRMGK